MCLCGIRVEPIVTGTTKERTGKHTNRPIRVFFLVLAFFVSVAACLRRLECLLVPSRGEDKGKPRFKC